MKKILTSFVAAFIMQLGFSVAFATDTYTDKLTFDNIPVADANGVDYYPLKGDAQGETAVENSLQHWGLWGSWAEGKGQGFVNYNLAEDAPEPIIGKVLCKNLEVEPQDNYLKVDTEESVFRRAGLPTEEGTYAQTYSMGAFNIKMNTQFTAASEGASSGIEDYDKMVLWMREKVIPADPDTQTEETVQYELVVTAGPQKDGTGTDYVLQGDYAPNTWYDVEIIPVDANNFKIKIGGSEVSGVNEGVTSLTFPKYAVAGFRQSELQAVGFQGNGAIDNLEFVSNAGNAKTFTLTWDEGVETLSYTVGEGDAVTIAPETIAALGTTFEVPAEGADITLAIGLNDGYSESEGTCSDGVAVSGDTITVSGDAINPSYAIKTTKNNFVVGSAYFESFNDAMAAAAEAGGTVTLNQDVVLPYDADNAGCIEIDGESSIIIDLKGYTLKDAAENEDYVIYSEGTLTIIDSSDEKTGKIMSDSPDTMSLYVGGGLTTIEAGIFENQVWSDDPTCLNIKGGKFKGNGTAEAFDLVDSIEDGYKAEQNGDYVAVVLDSGEGPGEPEPNYVAQIGAQKYETLDAAIEAATSEDEIDLIADIATTMYIEIKNKKVTIDLNGHSITAKNNTKKEVFLVWTENSEVKGELVLKDSVGTGLVDANSSQSSQIAVWAYKGGIVTIEGGKYTNVGAPEGDNFDLIYASHGGEITINGGTFECVTPMWTLNSLNENTETAEVEAGTIVVTGGKFVGEGANPAASGDKQENFVAEGYLVRTVTTEGTTDYTVEKGMKITYASEYAEPPAVKYVLSGYELTQGDLPELSEEGYTFKGWDKQVGYAIVGDTTITATWEEAKDAHDIIIENDIDLGGNDEAQVKDQIVDFDDAVGGHEKVSAYFNEVYGVEKVSASLVLGTTPELFKISEKFALPLLQNAPAAVAEKSASSATGFEFTIKDGDATIETLKDKAKKLIKYCASLENGSFEYSESDLSIVIEGSKIKVNFKDTSKPSGFMKVDFKVD